MKKIIILGAGESGVGSAILAKKNSYEVFVSDYGAIEMPVKKQFNELNIRFEENSHELAKSKDIDFVVKSPGISDTTDIIKFYLDKGVRIISEIEFAYNFSKSPIIGITGTNGKTTTTTLVHKLIYDANISCSISGNIGNSFSSVCDNSVQYSVVELSSFQLDGIDRFKPHIAILTSISPDHLDRYTNYKAYIESKFRIIKNQSAKDYLIYNS